MKSDKFRDSNSSVGNDIVKRAVSAHLDDVSENEDLERTDSNLKISRSFLANRPSVYIGDRNNYVNMPHVIALVGLPARGKTYIGRKLTRYLNWKGINTKIFNLGDYRRALPVGLVANDLFNPNNADGVALRAQIAVDALNDVCAWLESEDGEVAIFDATNTTRSRRSIIHDLIVGRMAFKLFFVESICNDQSIINHNIQEVKMSNPDYIGMNKEIAMKDFLLRIEHYKARYEPMDAEQEPTFSFMQLFNTGEKVFIHKQEGHVQAKIIYYLMNTRLGPRSIFFSRHGESEDNLAGRIGGDSNLTNRGKLYAEALAQYISEQNIEGLRVWTSWMKRTIQTAEHIPVPQERIKVLNEINAGLREEMTYAEIKERFPDEFVARDLNKFLYRYPLGESYEDLVARLEPIILELERQGNILIISHQAVLRCLLAYFLDKTPEELPYIRVPLHTIIKIIPVAYGCRLEHVKLPIAAVDTHRSKPKMAGYLDEKFRYTLKVPFSDEDYKRIEEVGIQTEDLLSLKKSQRKKIVPIITAEPEINNQTIKEATEDFTTKIKDACTQTTEILVGANKENKQTQTVENPYTPCDVKQESNSKENFQKPPDSANMEQEEKKKVCAANATTLKGNCSKKI